MRVKLISAFVIVVLVAIASMVFLVRLDSNRQVYMFMSRGGMVGLGSLVQNLEDHYRLHGSWEGVGPLLVLPGQSGDETKQGMGPNNMSRGMRLVSRLRLAQPDGLVIADTEPDGLGTLLTPLERQQAIMLRDRSNKLIGILFAVGGQFFATGYEKPLIDSINQAALRAGLLGVGIGLFMALALSGAILKPVLQLTRAAQKLASGDRSHRVQVNSNDEIGSLGQAFNTMAESLEQVDTQRKVMTADIAHELRTPLAVQRAHIEALQDGIYPLTRDNLTPVLDQTELLSRLVEDLRTLALVDAGELHLDFTRVNMVDLVQGIIGQFRSSAEQAGVSLELTDRCGQLDVRGDPDRLAQIFNNLMSNALRHTPHGGSVHIDMVCEEQNVTVTVRDTGSGIPPEALSGIFERFYRSDQSRSREQGGTGLGLAIARQLAIAHGGTLTAANSPLGGAEFILKLPVLPD